MIIALKKNFHRAAPLLVIWSLVFSYFVEKYCNLIFKVKTNKFYTTFKRYFADHANFFKW